MVNKRHFQVVPVPVVSVVYSVDNNRE